MPTNNRSSITENIVQFSDRGVPQKVISRIVGASKAPSQKSYSVIVRPTVLPAASRKDHTLFCFMREISLLSVFGVSGIDRANRTLCLHGPKTFGTSLIALMKYRQLRQTDSRSSSTLPHFGTLAAPDWNKLPRSHLIFADMSRVTPQNYNGRARPHFCHVVERLVDCCIRELRDQSGRGWPWTHQQILLETSADGSSSCDGVPICIAGVNDQRHLSVCH